MIKVVALMCAVGVVAAAEPNLHTIVADGAWTWFNDPRAVFHNGKLYVGYVRNADGKTALTSYDPITRSVETLWSSSFTERDDHNNPGLLRLEDGRMMAFYARHATDPHFVYRTSLNANPCTAADWGAEQLFHSTSRVTYSNPYQLSGEGGRIYNFMRNLNFNPTFTFSDDFGTNWSMPRVLIKAGTGRTRPYVKYASDSRGRIDFIYTDGHPRDVTNSLYHAYYQSGSLRRTDGMLLKPLADAPLLHDAGERGSWIYRYTTAETADPNSHIPSGRAWCWDLAYRPDGNPVCVFSVQRDGVTGTNWFDSRIYYYYARWTGKAWQKRFVAQAGRPLYKREDDYAGGICIDPFNPDTIYISSNAADPFRLTDVRNVPLRSDERYQIFKGTTSDHGATFSWQPVTQGPSMDNLRPYVPRGERGPIALVWFRGTYRTYTSYDCAVIALCRETPPTKSGSVRPQGH